MAGQGAGTVPVWDRFVRVFHWTTVTLFALEFVTDRIQWIHQPLAYAILVLVLARVAWGFVGSRHARFTDFVHRPRAVRAYLEDLRHGRARRYLGHNPAGGAMVVAILFMLVFVIASGWLSVTPEFLHVEWMHHVHHISAHLLLLMIFAHVAGVIWSSRLHRENLVRAMITGRKSAQVEAEDSTPAGPGIGARGPAV